MDSPWVLECIECGNVLESEPASFLCPKCGNLLQLAMRRLPVRLFPDGEGRISVWRYKDSLPIGEGVDRVSLQEGGTPLVKSTKIAGDLGLRELYIKNEGQNPTGSFKDRGMTVAVTRALDRGARLLICASTGNTSASLAAYAARSGARAAVIVPSGNVAAGKLTQAVIHGATIIRVKGNFDDALRFVTESISKVPGLYLVNSVNPYRIEGQKTVAFEIYEQLGRRVPDYMVMPVGNAGNISAAWKGFKELRDSGMTDRLPVMIGVQASGASPIAQAFAQGLDTVTPVENPKTVASAIRIGNPVSWKKALRAMRESKGMALAVSDEEILAARGEMASAEGIFVEAASATPIAAVKALRGRIPGEATVVCVGTGNGLKDQESVQWNVEDTPLLSEGSSLQSLLARMSG